MIFSCKELEHSNKSGFTNALCFIARCMDLTCTRKNVESVK